MLEVKCMYANKIDALMRSLIDGGLNFKNCNPACRVWTACKKLFVKLVRISRGNSFKDLKSDLGVIKERLSLNIFVWLRALFSIHL